MGEEFPVHAIAELIDVVQDPCLYAAIALVAGSGPTASFRLGGPLRSRSIGAPAPPIEFREFP